MGGPKPPSLQGVPTGVAHGTVTLIADGRPFEVTTLRATSRPTAGMPMSPSAATGGRMPSGATHDQRTLRRDDGDVIDLVGGLDDIESRTIRFIGEAEKRIREDYLRILRFFRFFAWYGTDARTRKGSRPVRA